MAAYLYGLESTPESFYDITAKFKKEHLTGKLVVDHLDGNVDNNRLSNLYIMRDKDNKMKGKLFQKIRAPYYWHSKRVEGFEEDLIEVEAGYNLSTTAKHIALNGTFNLGAYMEALRDFIRNINEGESIIGCFSECKENKENEEAKNEEVIFDDGE